MQTCDNDDDYNENIYKVSYHAFSSEHPFYRLLYFDSPDQATDQDNADNENMALPNARLSDDILTLLHPLLNNYIPLHHTRIYNRQNIIMI